MRRFAVTASLALALWAPAVFAQAGVYTDDLSKCLVRSSSTDDQVALASWVFAAMSLHPSVSAYVSMSDARRDTINRQAGKLMMRLITVDCRKETTTALKYEGAATMEAAFGVLGQVAMRDLMTDPKVGQDMASLGKYLDPAALTALAKEAGITTQFGAPAK